MTPTLFDCDPGHDDAIAMVIAHAFPEVIDLIGVSTVAGNQTVDKTTRNANKVLSFLSCDVPLCKGSAAPLSRPLITAPSVHGESGLDGPSLSDGTLPLSPLSVEEFLFTSLKPGTQILATGPLTNVAKLLLTHPASKASISRIVMMGGGIDHGNWSPAAEFNILVDPEAADIVFSSGIPIIMCPLDVTEKAYITDSEVEELRSVGEVGSFVAQLLDFFKLFNERLGFPGALLHDPCAAAYLVRPSLFKTEPYSIHVETKGKWTTGMTLADKRLNPEKEKPNAVVAMDLDRLGFLELLKESCVRCQASASSSPCHEHQRLC